MPNAEFTYNFYKRHLPGVTVEDINKVCKEWITNDGENAVIVLMSPSKDSASVPADDTIRHIFESIQKKELKPYVDKTSDKPLMATKPTPGKVTDTKEIKELGITEWTLSNGVKVFLKPTDFKNDEILFSAYRWGGTSLYSNADYMSAANAAQITDQSGLGQFSSTTLEKMLTGKVVGVSPFMGELSEGLTGQCSPQDMETEFQMTNMYFTQPRKDDTAFQAYISQNKGLIENRSV